MIGRKRRSHRLAKFVLAVAVLAVLAGSAFQLWPRLGGEGTSDRVEARAAGILDRAEQLLKDGKASEAAALLIPLAESTKDRNLGPKTLLLLARAEQAAGQRDLALGHLEKASKAFPNSPEQPVAAIAYARLLEEVGRPDEAAAVYASVRDTAPPDVRAPATTGLGRLTEKSGDLLKARDLYREAVGEAEWDSAAWSDAVDALGRANVAAIFSSDRTPESVVYSVARGDSLTSIGNKLNTTQGLLMRANGLGENAPLDVGQQLKYTPKDFRIVIERSRCRLFLLDKDGIFRVYAAGLGMPGHETTLGSYTLGNKQKDPVWHKPGEPPIPAGDPRNELGTRWMPLIPAKEGLPTDLGIHGTIAPESVGQFSSHGCARLRPAEVEELFDLVVRGTPVEIVEEYEPQSPES
ncbi:MAG: L,D-transpeptidase family protein [FCB group bacterium]|jgi:tetratricopeptide (TPR) repeat protein|nr:L,D-transpeptidase family protein [FCB group bacterium]